MLILSRLLSELGQSVNSSGHDLDTIAKDNSLFLGRRSDFHVERLSLHELNELLVVVKDLLDTIRRISSVQEGVRTICEGNELLDFKVDRLYLANLEHLLLCLQYQLIRLLIGQCVELLHRHLLDCRRNQSRNIDEWFFEFPNVQRPASTTWPWSIKPSLAVIWGVCWMFYDHTGDNTALRFDAEGNMTDAQGTVLVPHHIVHQYLSALRRGEGIYPSGM